MLVQSTSHNYTRQLTPLNPISPPLGISPIHNSLMTVRLAKLHAFQTSFRINVLSLTFNTKSILCLALAEWLITTHSIKRTNFLNCSCLRLLSHVPVPVSGPSAPWPCHENLTFLDFAVNIAISWQKLLIDLSICKSGVCSPIDFLKLHFRLLFICDRMYVHTHTNLPVTDWRQQLESICWKLALLYIKFDIHKMTCIFILIWNYGSSSYSKGCFGLDHWILVRQLVFSYSHLRCL